MRYIAAPKKGGFRLVSDYRAVNMQIEKVPRFMPNQTIEMADLRWATCLRKLDILQGYWQVPLGAEAQEMLQPPPLKVCLPPRVCHKAFRTRRPSFKV